MMLPTLLSTKTCVQIEVINNWKPLSMFTGAFIIMLGLVILAHAINKATKKKEKGIK